MSRTDSLIKAAIRALNENRELIDGLPSSLSSVQLDIKITKESLPFSVHIAPRWSQSMELSSVGVPCDISRFKFNT